jgi:hypothetical protein
MQQQVQTHLGAGQVIAEASSFFTKRRARVTDRSDTGFRFGLPGSDESGTVSVSSGAGGSGSTVTVEAEGLAILAIAEGFVRELRKQSRSQTRAGGGGGANAGFGDLRQRLGMPEPVRAPRPPQQGQQGQQPQQRPGAAPPGASPSLPGGQGTVRPDGPEPTEAASTTPEGAPQGAPAPQGAALPHPDNNDPVSPVQTTAADAPPVVNATSNAPPSAESQGGVPAPGDVVVHGDPALPNPGTPAGGASGAEAPANMGQESSEAPAADARLGDPNRPEQR